MWTENERKALEVVCELALANLRGLSLAEQRRAYMAVETSLQAANRTPEKPEPEGGDG